MVSAKARHDAAMRSAAAARVRSSGVGVRPGRRMDVARCRVPFGPVRGPFQRPPDYDYVPDCVAPQQPSTVQVLQGYGQPQ